MRTRWMIAGSLLTLVAIAALVVLGGVVLAQQDTDEATPEALVAEDELEPEAPARPRFGRRGFRLAWHHDRDHGLERLAEIIGISPDELREALTDGQTLAEIAADNGMARQELVDALLAEVEEPLEMVTAGELLDEEQVDFIWEWITDGVELLVDHPLPIGEEWEALDLRDWDDLLDAADFDLPARLADLMGLTPEELLEALLDGQTLAEIAAAHGVDPQTVVDFLVAEAEAELDEAVAAGHLSAEQAVLLRGWVVDGVERIMDNRFVFPNGLEMVERLGTRFGAHLEGIDWDGWVEFDWGAFIGQDPLSVAAEAIGISRGELLAALMDGQSLAEVATAHGVDLQVVIDAQTASLGTLLDDLAAEGLIPDHVPGLVEGHLDLGMEMFAEHGFPFAEHWEGTFGDWAPWGNGDHPQWLEEWFDCCPCDNAESGE